MTLDVGWIETMDSAEKMERKSTETVKGDSLSDSAHPADSTFSE
jgi:hypothetical protein